MRGRLARDARRYYQNHIWAANELASHLERTFEQLAGLSDRIPSSHAAAV